MSLKTSVTKVVSLFAPDWKQIKKMAMNIPNHTENNFIATRE